MSKINEYIKALQNGNGFDWIAKHGHELNKFELIDIVKEFDYAIHSMGICDGKEDLYDAVYESLNDIYEEIDEV